MKSRRINPADNLPTAVDVLAAGLCPFLIMVLVGSLAFFIKDVLYHGAHDFRLNWLIVWCVLAMVGISRIAIEKTPAYAGMYALGLGFAAYIFVSRFFEMPLVGWLILIVIWWCTNKLVYDCTLIDEKTDVSGTGLLGVAGIDETDSRATPKDSAPTGDPKNRISIWKKLFTNARAKTDQPHAPGLWVVYFSIAALPIFGFGQLLVATRGAESSGFAMVIIYLVAAIALLLLTSFLGLRRYLRQRRLKMPATMASRWIATGAGIMVAVFLVSLVLPRPLPSIAGGQRTHLVDGKEIENDHYVDGGDEEQGDVELDSEENGRGEEKENTGEGDEQGQKDERQPGEDQSGEGESEQRASSSSTGVPNIFESTIVRLILWGLFAIAVALFAWRHRQEIVDAVRQLWEEFRNLFRRSPRQKKKRRKQDELDKPVELPAKRMFAELNNPFASGESSMPPEVVVGKTFDALEVWAAELGCARDRQMTANEFARELTHRHPDAKLEINRLISLYTGSLYADRAPRREELPPLANLWNYMAAQTRDA